MKFQFDLQFVGGRNARPRLGNLGFKGGSASFQLDESFTTLSLLDIVLSNAIFLQASERNFLFQKRDVRRFASSSALSHGLLGNANLTGLSDDGVFQNGAGTSLSLQRFGNLGSNDFTFDALTVFLVQLLLDMLSQRFLLVASLGVVFDPAIKTESQLKSKQASADFFIITCRQQPQLQACCTCIVEVLGFRPWIESFDFRTNRTFVP